MHLAGVVLRGDQMEICLIVGPEGDPHEATAARERRVIYCRYSSCTIQKTCSGGTYRLAPFLI